MNTKPLEKISVIPQAEPSTQVPALANWMTPMSMLDRAISGGASIEVLEKLMGLQERHEANQARKAFNNALADAAAELPIIRKNRHVSFGTTSYDHEDLAEVVDAVAPILGRHGLKHRWRLKGKPGEPVTVWCIISHRDGYQEENELSAAADTSGAKNAIQGVKSAVSYLERITLMASLGLASRKDDDDGKRSEGTVDTITQAQADTLRDLIEANGKDRAAFLKWAARSDPKVERIEDIAASAYDSCVQAIQYKAPAK